MNFSERYRILCKIYEDPCPVCGKKWSFELTPKGWNELKGCHCKEQIELIDQRSYELFGIRRDERKS